MRSTRWRLAPELAVDPSLKTRYRTCRTAARRSERSDSGGNRKRAPLALIRCLARLMRWATVASGTSSALAISAVVRPPTARRVNATCETGVKDGWQQSRSSSSESSDAAPWSMSSGVEVNVASSRRRRAVSLRHISVRRRVATTVNQPRGFSGTPAAGHCVAAASNASCTASSQMSKSSKRRTRIPRTCGARLRNRSSMPFGSLRCPTRPAP